MNALNLLYRHILAEKLIRKNSDKH